VFEFIISIGIAVNEKPIPKKAKSKAANLSLRNLP